MKSPNVVDDETGLPVTAKFVLEKIAPWTKVVEFCDAVHNGMIHLTMTEYEMLPATVVDALKLWQRSRPSKQQELIQLIRKALR